jgi:hypothetical protein
MPRPVELNEVLPVTAADAGRALGPMLPSSARELWPFCVLRDSCHAAVPISQVYHQLARDAGLVALAAAHASADLQLTNTASMQLVCGYAAWVLLCQIARKWSKRALSLGLEFSVVAPLTVLVLANLPALRAYAPPPTVTATGVMRHYPNNTQLS